MPLAVHTHSLALFSWMSQNVSLEVTSLCAIERLFSRMCQVVCLEVTSYCAGVGIVGSFLDINICVHSFCGDPFLRQKKMPKGGDCIWKTQSRVDRNVGKMRVSWRQSWGPEGGYGWGKLWALVPEIPQIGFILTTVLLIKDKEKRWSINYEITFWGPI